MHRGKKQVILASLLVGIVSIGGLSSAQAAITSTPLATNTSSNDTAAQPIDGCTVINSSGRYVLTQDIEMSGEDPCISITANDVELDGAGHTLFERQAYSDSVGIATASATRTNVTVKNVTVNGSSLGIAYTNVSHGHIDGVTVRNAGKRSILLEGDNNTVTNSTVRDGGWNGVQVRGPHATLKNNTFMNVGSGIYTWSETNNDYLTVADNDLQNSRIGLDHANYTLITGNKGGNTTHAFSAQESHNLTVTNNRFTGSLYIRSYKGTYSPSSTTENITITNNTLVGTGTNYHLELSSVRNVDIENNVISTPKDPSTSSDGIILRNNVGGPVTIAHNNITNDHAGIVVKSAYGNLNVRGNNLNDNSVAAIQVEQLYSDLHVNGSTKRQTVKAELSVHGNTMADDGIGIQNKGSTTVNATQNYWGAADGPSSVSGPNAPYHDPVTDAPADGNGSAVTQKPCTVGISNVHFDSWLTQAPSDVGVENSTAN